MARVSYNLGVLYTKLGYYQQAKEVLELALSIYRKKLGREHSDFVNTHFWLDLAQLGDQQMLKELNDFTLSMEFKAALPIRHTRKRKIAYNCNKLKYKCYK